VTAVTAQDLLTDLGRLGVKLEVASGGKLRYSPLDRVDAATLERLKLHKLELIAVLSEPPVEEVPRFVRQEFERASELGLAAKWSMEFGYISMHDPLSGEWHDLPTKKAPSWAKWEAGKRKELDKAGNRRAYRLTSRELQRIWEEERVLAPPEEGIVEEHPLEEGA
jgi:hypothetical protein